MEVLLKVCREGGHDGAEFGTTECRGGGKRGEVGVEFDQAREE